MAKRDFQPVDLSHARTVPLVSRASKVQLKEFAIVGSKGLSFRQFMENLPRQLKGTEVREVIDTVVNAHQLGKPVIWGMGAHVIKCGLSPLVIELMRRGVITAVAMNGAGVIHDVEIALVGHTSEEVSEGLNEGLFGMAEETGRLINTSLEAGVHLVGKQMEATKGIGSLVGERLLAENAPYTDSSILAWGIRLGVPVTVHLTIGADITHMHPTAQGAVMGATTFYDFRLLTAIVTELGNGGVFLNIGSAVVLPEVFLKALNLARNLGRRVANFSTVNLDMLQHYRPLQNVVHRPTLKGGKGFAITGHHEIMVPLLVQGILEKLE